MNENDKHEFAALMTGIAELYNKKISNTLLSIYWNSLKRFEFKKIKGAVEAHVNDPEAGQFMVKPADIVRHIEGNWEIHALRAYSKVESTIRHIGSYTSVAFDDRIIHAVIDDMGGWVKFCSIKTEAVPFQTNEFIKRYIGYLIIQPSDYPRYMRGLFDNPSKPPLLVGDKNKAKEVMAGGCDTHFLIHQGERPLLENYLDSVEDINHSNHSEDDNE